jgi:glucose/arabinose dehydrogenase
MSRAVPKLAASMKSFPVRVRIASTLFAAVLQLGAFASQPAVELKKIAEGFVSPLNLLSLPDSSGRLLIGDQIGVIKVVNKDGNAASEPFADLREKMVKLPPSFDERGLLGIALHPQFQQNRKLYIFYSAPRRASAATNYNCTSHLSEFRMKNADSVDLSSERILLEIDKPQMNHNGGRIAFGPDGYLYVGVGDGGGANDNEMGHSPKGNGQDTTKLLGKILRIDVNKGEPYAIPSDNPFADAKAGRPEIYALGLRNPWGFSFDRGGSHELFSADVGQNRFEEVNIIAKGGNYGWNLREGFTCFDPKKPNSPPDDCPKVAADGRPLVDPIVAYKNFGAFKKDPESRGISVTGGYVYRGKAIPQLQGKYIFGDWSRNWAKADGTIFVATRPGSSAEKWSLEVLKLTDSDTVPHYIVAFGEDADGELYVLTNDRNGLIGVTGKVFKLVPRS